jgi:aspartyl-tRNA(Asn)/glutamyl-tRNA(Gln) amidotransferase subunit B
VRSTLPALPSEIRDRLLKQYDGLTSNHVDVLMSLDADREIDYDGNVNDDDPSTLGAVAYFEELCKPQRNPRVVANWSVFGFSVID